MTEQLPDERLHDEDGENVPVPFVVHVTVPVGKDPFTVAVHAVAIPTDTGDVAQVTDVVSTFGPTLTATSAQPSLVDG